MARNATSDIKLPGVKASVCLFARDAGENTR
jgi:hypothetical protein